MKRKIKLILVKLLKFLSDKMYLKIMYFLYFHKKLDLDNPKTYNEKLQWLKLYDRKDIYSTMVDKYEAKEYVANIIGEEYIIPTLGIYNTFDEINFDELPNQFVIKCTHDSGGLVICKDKSKLDLKLARKKITKCLKKNFYYVGREWPYKNVKPRIIIEKYMEDSKLNELRDYKFLCFNGIPKVMFIATDRQNGITKFNYYDMNFNFLDIKQGHPNDNRKIDKPINFNKMKKLAQKLSAGIPNLRVDFYEIDGKLYFGELTFFHYSGFMKFEPDKWDYEFGEYLNINKLK